MAGGKLAEILGALSMATDLAAGQPTGTALSASVLATRIGRLFDLGEADLSAIYYACITRRIGCTSTAAEVAQFALGDEHAINHALNLSDLADPASMRHYLDQRLDRGKPTGARRALIDQLVDQRAALCHAADAHCMQAVALARRLPVPQAVSRLLEQVDSRWDGGSAEAQTGGLRQVRGPQEPRRATARCGRPGAASAPQAAEGRAAEPAGDFRRAGGGRLRQRARDALQGEVGSLDAGDEIGWP
jgi:hypothetical protein